MIRAAIISGARLSRPRRADGPRAILRGLRVRLRGSISPDAVNSIAQAFQTEEGYYPGSIAYQNNNPGNLVYAGQAGAVPGAGGFASFSSYSAGYQALEDQITLDATRGTDVNGNPTGTLSQLISSWAPPSENDTASYIAAVSQSTGFNPDAPLSTLGTSAAGSTVDAGVSFLDSTVDFSQVGILTPVPIYWLVGAGLIGVALLRD